MNWYAKISVYASAKDNVGHVMSLTDFMLLGHQMKEQIEQYRQMKRILTQLTDRAEALFAMRDGLNERIDENRNPLGGVESDEVYALIKELSQVEDEIHELEGKVAAQKTLCENQKRHFPAATLSGWFSPTRARANLQEHSGFICIDIDDHYTLNDKTYTQTLVGIRELLESLPWVMYAAHSVGGAGYFVLIPLGPVDAQHPHEWYFDCLKDEFEQMGIVIDRACRDTTRLRFLSYDDEPIRNPRCEHYFGNAAFVSQRERNEREQEQKRKAAIEAFRMSRNGSSRDQFGMVEVCIEKLVQMHPMNCCDEYQEWITAGASLAKEFGERGRQFFHTISSMSSKYDAAYCDKTYSGLMSSIARGSADKKEVTIASLFSIFKKYGIYFKNPQ